MFPSFFSKIRNFYQFYKYHTQIKMKQSKETQPELIGHGAEAKVFKHLNQKGQPFVIKERLPKKYRHPKLDAQLNTSRVKSETKVLQKVKKMGVNVPTVIKMDATENKIYMEFIEGKKLKDHLNQTNEEEIIKCLKQLGNIILKLHCSSIIHGDLTTSNMILSQGHIYLLDFGLGALTATIEDKAVDLYLFEKAFIATHPQLEDKFKVFLETYGEKSVLTRLDQVRMRGRKKVAFG